MRVTACVGDATWEDDGQRAPTRSTSAPTWIEGDVDFAVSIVTQCISMHIFIFFKKKKHWRTSGIPAAKCREAGLFCPKCGHDKKTP